MTDLDRKAGVLWTGDLKNGNGLISTESRASLKLPTALKPALKKKLG